MHHRVHIRDCQMNQLALMLDRVGLIHIMPYFAAYNSSRTFEVVAYFDGIFCYINGEDSSTK